MQSANRVFISKWIFIGLILVFFITDDWYGNQLVCREIDMQASIRLKNQAMQIRSIYNTYGDSVDYLNEQTIEADKEKVFQHLKTAYTVADSYYRQYLRGVMNKKEAQERTKQVLAGMPYEDTSKVWILDTDELRLKKILISDYPQLKEELADHDFFMEKVNESRRNGFAYYHLSVSETSDQEMKKGLIMDFRPWNWELVVNRYETDDEAKSALTNKTLTKVLDDTTQLLSAMDNLAVLSREGYLSYHDLENDQKVTFDFVGAETSFYQDVVKASEGEKALLVFPDGKAKWSYVLSDQQHSNWLILIQDVDLLEQQKRNMIRFNRLIESVNLLLIAALVLVFSSGVFERREKDGAIRST